jgi:hypothetical protein
VYKTRLCRMNQRARVACRAWLKLLTYVPDAMLHTSVGSGGMGIPSLLTRIPLIKQKRLKNCLTASDPAVQTCTRAGSFLKDQKYWAGPVRVKGTECRSATECAAAWAVALGNTVDGRGAFPQAPAYPRGSSWVSTGTRLLSGGDYIKTVKVRCSSTHAIAL